MFNELNEKGIGKYIDLDKWGFSTFTLKMVAAITMFIDHFAVLYLTDYKDLYNLCRAIGRLSFPIFCFILVEGFYHTKNKMNHAILLGIFGLVSEIPYNMMYGSFFDLSRQNVILTLFIGYMVIWALDSISMFKIDYSDAVLKKVSAGRLNALLELIAMAVGFGMAYFLNTSYSYGGVLLIICFYVFRKYHLGRAIINLVFNLGMFGFGIQWFGALSVIPIGLYNERVGKYKWKYFFYIFYPLHLFLLSMAKYIYFSLR